MNDPNYRVECFACRKGHSEEESITACVKCNSPLEVIYDYDKIAERVNKQLLKTAPLKAIKYLDFYPLRDYRKVISMDEGGTPLYKAKRLGKKLGLKNLFIKNEGANPTGAFKDRGSMVEITKAKELGKKAICVASTGNMAASVSAYANKAGIPCYILVPEGVAIGKMSQTTSYGGRIIQVRGTYDDAATLTQKMAKEHNFYLAGDYAFRLEGQKSIGFEIAEQLDWNAPDKVIMPMGCGTNISAVWKGFKEFKGFDFIDSLPEMVGAQARGANPIVEAVKKHKKKFAVLDKPETVASAVSVGNPLDGLKAIKTITESGGFADDFTDVEILEAEKLLAKEEALFVEPAAALPLAALIKAKESNKIKGDETVVMVMTGSGLKDPLTAMKVMPRPPSVEPDLGEINKFLDYGYYNVFAMSNLQQKPLFSKLPRIEELSEKVKKEFGLELNPSDAKFALLEVRGFFEKGKKPTKSDLQYILEGLLRRPKISDRKLIVKNYWIESNKHDKPRAKVEIEFFKKKIVEEGDGVGPVDAVINAIQKAVKKNGLSFKLIDYTVEINTKGTDAAVDVKMTLQDAKKNKIESVGTSPDIIAASVDAFEYGYNALCQKSKK